MNPRQPQRVSENYAGLPPSPRPHGPPHRPAEVVSHYRLGERLGVGGMGEVFLADDLVLGRRAALKLLPKDWDEELRRRLLREARATARLEHPGIATFYESDETGGVAFLAMEYVEGETLRSRLNRGPLPLDEALGLTACILEALAHAHAMNILHRDIKPENIMIRPDGLAKLLDFGLAKSVERNTLDGCLEPSGTGRSKHSPEEAASRTVHPPGAAAPIDEGRVDSSWTQITHHDLMAGTPGYMSPEQIMGLPLGPRSDLFAVGLVLYEMVSGRPAFPGTTQERLAAALHSQPTALPANLPDGFSAVLGRAIARDESERYSTAASFLSDLRGIGRVDIIDVLPETLALLGFQNLSGNEDDDWIGTGMLDGVMAGLAGVPGVEIVAQARVVGARASFPEQTAAPGPIDLGARLACRWVMTGDFRREADVLHARAVLFEVSTGRAFSLEALEGKLDEIFGIQDRLLAFIADRLGLTTGGRGLSGTSLEAYECHARGRKLFQGWQRGALEEAAELFAKAIQADPRHGPSLSALAMVCVTRYLKTTDPRQLDETIGYARRAIEIDPSNAETHVWLGYALWRQGHHEEALGWFLKAQSLDSHNHFAPYFTGCCLTDQGRHAKAVGYLQRSIQCNPAFSWAGFTLGWAHLELGLFDEARWCLEQAVDLEQDPVRSTNQARPFLSEALRRSGDLDAARAVCLEALDFVERSDAILRDQSRGFALCVLGRTALEQADLPAARVAFSQALAHVRARPRGMGLGHLVVQCLAGQSRAGEGPAPLAEALAHFEDRNSPFNFCWAGPLSKGVTLLELARAAQAVGRADQARSLLGRARAAGSGEAIARVEFE